ncbi:BnaAnng40710D, partial [Brassica napus]
NEFKRIVSPLKYQTRCVTAFPDQQGFLVYHRNCSTEVRVGVHHLDDSQQNKNFTFKYHRDGNEIYSINALNFHPLLASLPSVINGSFGLHVLLPSRRLFF